MNLLGRLGFLLFLAALLPCVALSQAQGQQTDPAPKSPTIIHGQPVVTFTYKTVLVKYVAGTLPYDETTRRSLLGKMGCLVATQDALIYLRYDNQSPESRAAGFLTHLISPTWAKGRHQCQIAANAQQADESEQASKTLPPARSIPIDFNEMEILARGQVQSMSSETGSDFSLLSGIGSLAALAALKTTSGYIGLGLVSGVSIGYYVHRRTENYMTVFIGKQKRDSKGDFSACGSGGNRCDFVVFQIIDPHDYWNTSILLNAMTGKTFISETMEKSGN